MNIFRTLPALVLSVASVAFPSCSTAQEEATDFGLVGRHVANYLQEKHYNGQDFDDVMGAKTLQNYLDYLDYNRLYFTKGEVEQFKKEYNDQLDVLVLTGDLSAAYKIYGLYETKVKSRFEKVKKLLTEGKLDLESKRTTEISRKDAEWAESEEQIDKLWEAQITREVLQERLSRLRAEERKKRKAESAAKEEGKKEGETPAPATPAAPGKKPKTPEEKVLERYQKQLDFLKENDEEDKANFFLSSLASAYDPHSEYFSAPEQDSFTIDMSKSLIGIGAQLSMKDGAAEIRGLVPGGPAQKAGTLQLNDLVIGVGEGLDGEIKDVEGMKLQKIVEMIRGSENTTVRLRIHPASDPTATKEIAIVREKVDLKESRAKAELIEYTPPGQSTAQRIGWISLDAFYADMDGGRNGVSATRDVKRLLERLMKEGVQGVVLDLRGNGGGALEEAINLTGLFVRKGPVVLQRGKHGSPDTRNTRVAEPMYTGPLVVAVDRQSASASEITAAALQDYGRAVIVGDEKTFGKGTVQTIVAMRSQLPLLSASERAGSLKLTIQKFYRISGESTQFKGVASDVVLPSRFEAVETGEESLKFPLPWDAIDKVDYEMAPTNPLPKDELKKRSEGRVSQNPEFGYIRDFVKRTQDLIKKNVLSLNEAERIAEEKANEERAEQQKKERKARVEAANKAGDPFKVYPLNLETVDAPLSPDTEKKEDSTKIIMAKDEDAEEETEEQFPHGIDPAKGETMAVLRDLIELTGTKSTAAAEKKP